MGAEIGGIELSPSAIERPSLARFSAERPGSRSEPAGQRRL